MDLMASLLGHNLLLNQSNLKKVGIFMNSAYCVYSYRSCNPELTKFFYSVKKLNYRLYFFNISRKVHASTCN